MTCKKEPIECQIVVDRGRGFTICQFVDIVAAERDTSKIKAITSMFQGREVKSNQVSAIMISQSEFDEVPSSIFTSFGDVFRLKFNGGKLKKLKKESFVNATHLRSFEAYNTTIEEISSSAFDGATELSEIALENCKIGKIAEDAFAGLENLKKVRLTGSKYPNANFLKNLPESVETIELP
jgi:hypothetical protein